MAKEKDYSPLVVGLTVVGACLLGYLLFGNRTTPNTLETKTTTCSNMSCTMTCSEAQQLLKNINK